MRAHVPDRHNGVTVCFACSNYGTDVLMPVTDCAQALDVWRSMQRCAVSIQLGPVTDMGEYDNHEPDLLRKSGLTTRTEDPRYP